MTKHSRERKPKFNSTAYYIEEVVRYRSEHESAEDLKESYPPVMLAILISVRAIRGAICLLTGALLFLLLKLILML